MSDWNRDKPEVPTPRENTYPDGKVLPSMHVGKIDFTRGQSESIVPKDDGGSLPQKAEARSMEKPYAAELMDRAIRSEYVYGSLGLVLGLACIIGGVILGLNGVAGATSWTASLLGLKSKINDAAPGVVLFIVGIFLVWITKPKIRIGEVKG